MTVKEYNEQIKEIQNIINGYKAKLDDLTIKRDIQIQVENNQITIDDLLKP